ncbi:hypothetical protein MesoLj113b_64330 [Mesorhizobium sp. 113-3-3]|nr:hypothetical protein MesoLj113b_64330 [Mesorhizobium sp. 113-3-3]BCG90768.1 hypothetical protein MesoLj113c_68780 [Mesorhizobium sp. 113-3-9]
MVRSIATIVLNFFISAFSKKKRRVNASYSTIPAYGDYKNEIGFTRHIICARNLGCSSNGLLETIKDICAIAFEIDIHQHEHWPADGFGRNYSYVSFDDSLALR